MTEPGSPGIAPEFQSVPAFVPEAYANGNAAQRTAGIEAFELLKRSTGSVSMPGGQLLDVGCGTGNFTCEELLPRCQPCRRIVATDVSEEMVRYAKEHFGHPQISYEVHDIKGGISGLLNKYGKFDQVYSFYALQWVKDQKAAFRNIADLMTDDGEAFLVFPGRWAGYDAWRKIVQMDRWKPYKEICESFIAETHDLKYYAALKSYMLDVLKNAGLKAHICEVVPTARTIKELDQTVKTNIALIPILPLLPEHSRPDLETDLTDVLRNILGDTAHTKCFLDTFIIYATKGRQREIIDGVFGNFNANRTECDRSLQSTYTEQ